MANLLNKVELRYVAVRLLWWPMRFLAHNCFSSFHGNGVYVVDPKDVESFGLSFVTETGDYSIGGIRKFRNFN